ncbi:hypothetical protein DBV15_07174 [Temnothorax longispinosus]|uniref:Uncharacterized protein n=1 Tax=Temnothorax longispinosus TaxID=300112 RepID=A0A4S2KJY7_9HYME|nr:hypothetical protein DBV15_07174 [Temnothorax longispinosus]
MNLMNYRISAQQRNQLSWSILVYAYTGVQNEANLHHLTASVGKKGLSWAIAETDSVCLIAQPHILQFRSGAQRRRTQTGTESGRESERARGSVRHAPCLVASAASFILPSRTNGKKKRRGHGTRCSRREKRETQMNTEAEAALGVARLGSPRQHHRHLGSRRPPRKRDLPAGDLNRQRGTAPWVILPRGARSLRTNVDTSTPARRERKRIISWLGRSVTRSYTV